MIKKPASEGGLETPKARTAPSHMARPRDTISQRDRKAMGLPDPGRPDPGPGRMILLKHIGTHGPMRACDMLKVSPSYVAQLIWLQREGLIDCDRTGRKTSTWDITAAGRREIKRVGSLVVPARSRAFAGSVSESPEIRWPDVRSGGEVAMSVKSKGT